MVLYMGVLIILFNPVNSENPGSDKKQIYQQNTQAALRKWAVFQKNAHFCQQVFAKFTF